MAFFAYLKPACFLSLCFIVAISLFIDNFDVAHHNNTEFIYEIQRAINNGSTDGGSADIGTGLNAPQGSDINAVSYTHLTLPTNREV